MKADCGKSGAVLARSEKVVAASLSGGKAVETNVPTMKSASEEEEVGVANDLERPPPPPQVQHHIQPPPGLTK
jgi:hypothetical protein